MASGSDRPRWPHDDVGRSTVAAATPAIHETACGTVSWVGHGINPKLTRIDSRGREHPDGRQSDAFLWRAIKLEDLRDKNGDYWQWSGDLCFMYPMLEMSGEEHYRFMTEINYDYNANNPINEHKVDMKMVTDHANKIRGLTPYKKLER